MYARKAIFNIYALKIAYKCRNIRFRIRLRESRGFLTRNYPFPYD